MSSPTSPQLLHKADELVDAPLQLVQGGTALSTESRGLDALAQWELGVRAANLALGIALVGFDPLGKVRKGQRD